MCRCKGFEGFIGCLPTLQLLIRDAITSKRQRCPEALRCVGILAVAVRSSAPHPPPSSLIYAHTLAPACSMPRRLRSIYGIKRASTCRASQVGSAWRPHIEALLDPMFSTGLSEVLVESLTKAASALPELLPLIQTQLLDLISLALARQPFRVMTLGHHDAPQRFVPAS